MRNHVVHRVAISLRRLSNLLLSAKLGFVFVVMFLVTSLNLATPSHAQGWGVRVDPVNVNRREGTSTGATIRYQGPGTSPSILVRLGGTADGTDFDVNPDMDGIQALTSESFATIIRNVNRVTSAVAGPAGEISARVTIAPDPLGVTDIPFSLLIADDMIGEGDETLTITVTDPQPDVPIFTGPEFLGSQMITIRDLVRTWAIDPTNQTVSEGNDVSYTISYTGLAGETVSILVTVDLGNAQANDFFSSGLTSGILRDSISGGTPTAGAPISAMVETTIDGSGMAFITLELTIRDDEEQEDDETFRLELSQPSLGTTITTATATTNIAASDITGIWSITSANQTVNEGDDASYTVQYTGNSAAEQGSTVSILVTVDLDTENDLATAAEAQDFFTSSNVLNSTTLESAISGGTATAGDSGISAMVELTIAANGNASASITLPIFDDNIFEGDDTFTVELSQPSTGAITNPTVTTTIAVDPNDVSGNWLFITDVPVEDNEIINEEGRVGYVIQYESGGTPVEQGAILSILVSVEFTGENSAQAEDFDPILTSETLSNAITFTDSRGGRITNRTPSNDGISTRVDLSINLTRIFLEFNLRTNDDSDLEDDEFFTVRLSEQTPGTSIFVTTRTITIAANDMTWIITPETQTILEGETASYNVQYRGLEGARASIRVMIDLGTADGFDPAEANDLNPPLTSAALASAINNGTVSGGTRTARETGGAVLVTLVPDATENVTFSFDLGIADDAIQEDDEIFGLMLDQPSVGSITDDIDTATVTIPANDSTPEGMWSITQTSIDPVNEGQNASYTVQYDGSAAEQGSTASILVTVDLSDTASAEDFDPTLTSADLVDAIRGDDEVDDEDVTAGPSGISAMVELTIREGGIAVFDVDLTIRDDAIQEGDQTFTVRLSIPSGQMTTLVNNSDTVTTTIAASDIIGEWSISQAQTRPLNEGEVAGYTVLYLGNAILNEQGARVSILVSVEFTGANPAMADDFDPPPLTSDTLRDAISGGPDIEAVTAGDEISAMVVLVTDSNGSAGFVFNLSTTNDPTAENDETFTVRISIPSEETTDLTNNQDTVTTTIAANDMTWTILPENQTVNEGEAARYTVQYNGVQGNTPSIVVTVDLSETADENDFTSPPLTSAALASAINRGTETGGTRTAAAITTGTEISAMVELSVSDVSGNLSFSFDLSIFDDTEFEPDETFTVSLSQASRGEIFIATATTIIPANDPSGTWAITQTSTGPVNEGDDASYRVDYTGTSTEQGVPVSILITVDLGTAEPEDFAITSSSLPLNSTTLRNAISGGTGTGITGTINTRVWFTILDTGNASFSFDLPINNDAEEEGPETFMVTLSSQMPDTTTIATPTATTTIAASDPRGTWDITQDPEDGIANEGETVTYTVQYNSTVATQGLTVSIMVTVDLGPALDNDFTFPLTSANLVSAISGGDVADVNAVENTRSAVVELTIDENGTARASFDLTIADDNDFEPEETFTVTLSDPSGETTLARDPASVTTTIAPNDLSGTWSISSTTSTVNEDDDESASYEVRYTGSSAAEQNLTVSILVSVTFDTAEAEDFDADLTSATLSQAISAGTATAGNEISTMVAITTDANGNANFSFVLPIRNDGIEEAEETFTVTLSQPSGGSSVDSASDSVTTTIANSDVIIDGIWAITPENQTVNEGDDASYTVQYTGSATEQGARVSILVSVEFTGANPAMADDFDPPPLTSDTLRDAISGGPGVEAVTAGDAISAMVVLVTDSNGSADFVFNLSTTNDPTAENDETFTVTISIPSEETTDLTNNQDTVTTTIAANDMVPSGTWAITTTTPTVSERGSASYTLQYTGNPEEQGSKPSIRMSVRLSSAEAEDFDPTLTSDTLADIINEVAPKDDVEVETVGTSGIRVTVILSIDESGNASVSFDLSIADDPAFELEEIFELRLSHESDETTIQNRSVTTTIDPSEQPSGTWAISQLTEPVNEGETVRYTVQYTGNPASAEQGATVSIQIMVGFPEQNPASDEDFNLTPTNANNLRAAILAAANTAQGTTITSASIGSVLDEEGGLTGGVSVSFILSENDASFSIDLAIADDQIFEPEETFTVRISEQTEETTIDTPIATTTIVDNNTEGIWTITSENQTVNEGDTASYTVQYNGAEGPLEMLVTVDLSGAASIEDFDADPTTTGRQILTSASLATLINASLPEAEEEAMPGPSGISAMVELNIPSARTRSFSFELAIFDDAIEEGDETFTIRVSEQLRDPTQDPVEATTTIDANDRIGEWAITSANQEVNEGDSASYDIRYTGGNSEETVSILVTFDTNTAEANDVDADPNTPGRQLINGESLTALIGAGAMVGVPRGARLSLTTDINGDAMASFALPIVDDTELEDDENFMITLSEPDPERPVPSASVITTIAASDRTPGGMWAITPENQDVNEGDSASYTVRYTGTSADAQGATVSILVTVGFTTGQEQANDFTSPLTSTSLATFIGNGAMAVNTGISARLSLTTDMNRNAMASFALPILDDTELEEEEIFTVTLSEPSAETSVTSASVITTIAANDMTPGGMWDISTTTPTVNEGNDASYTVQYTTTNAAEQGSTVSILVMVGFPVTNPAQVNDFTPDLNSAALVSAISVENPGIATTDPSGISAMVALTIGVDGNETFSFALPIFDDMDPEGDETFTVTLSDPSDNSSVPSASNSVTTMIVASDLSGNWAITPVTATVNEEDTVTYTVEYDSTAEPNLTVSILVTVTFDTASAEDFDTDLTSATLSQAISAGTATAGNEISTMVAITTDANGNANFSFDLTINNDNTPENDETFTVILSEESVGTITAGTATTTIAANDRTWAISPDNQRINEGDQASYTVEYRGVAEDTASIIVAIDIPSFLDVTPGLTLSTLRNAINNGTETEGTRRATITPERILLVEISVGATGNLTFSFNLRITDDESPEVDIDFRLTLERPSVGIITNDTATVTIPDNDMTPSGTWAISTTTPTVNEGDDATSYTVQYTTSNVAEQGATASILVTVDLSQTAANDDFTPTLTSVTLSEAINSEGFIMRGGTVTASTAMNEISAMVALTIDASGNASTSFALPIADDETQEGEETFTVTLAIPVEEITTLVPNSTTATTTIAASDIEGTWDISQASTAPVNEGETASYSIQYTTTADSAEQGAIVAIMVTVGFTGENQAQAEDFDLPLTSETLATIIGPEATADSSGISAMVELITDANGAASASFDLSIDDDMAFELEETFTVTLSSPTTGTTITTNTATTTIAASDLRGTWAISSTTSTVNEAESARYNVLYTGPSDEQGATISILVTVDLDTAEAEDFTSTLTSDTLRDAINQRNPGIATTDPSGISAMVALIIDGNGNASFNFDLTINDDQTQEGDEAFMVTLSGQTPETTINTDSVTTTIAASDISGTWAISQTPTEPVDEGGTVNYTVQYTIGDGTTADAEQGAIVAILVTVEFPEEENGTNPAMAEDFETPLTSATLRDAISGGTATPSTEISAMVELTIDANGNASASVVLPILDDTTSEGDETFTVTLAEQTPGTMIITPTATTTIADNDLSGNWDISQTSTDPVNEGDDASYTVQYTPTNTAEQGATVAILVTVDLDTAAAEDFDFNPTLTSDTLRDAINQRNPGIATTDPSGISAMVALIIDDTGNASFSFDLMINDDNTPENDETFMVTLSGQTTGTTITIPTATTTIATSDIGGIWAIISETATVNEDESASYNVLYTGNSTTEQGSTVSILITVEFPEEENGVNPAMAEDFGPPPLTSATLRDAITGDDVEVVTVGATEISATVALTIDANGRAIAIIALPILDDATPESTETFTVTLSEQTQGTTIATNTVTTAIAADDPSGTWAIRQDPVDGSANENETVTYTIEYTGNPVTQGVSVSILVTVEFTGENPADANDFTPTLDSAALVSAISVPTATPSTEISAMVPLTIDQNGNANFSIALPIADDTTIEGEETFTVSLSEPSQDTNVDTSANNVITAIADSDQGWGVAVVNLNPNEGRSVDAQIRYQGTQSSPSILVRIDGTADGTADGNDFDIDSLTTGIQPLTSEALAAILESINGVTAVVVDSPGAISAARVTIDPESVRFDFNFFLNLVEDTVVEGNETLTITVTDPQPDASILNDAPFAGSQTINIIDVVRTWTFTSTDQTVNENEGETADYTVQYTTSNLAERQVIEILVTVGFTTGQAQANDFTPTLNSAALASAISGLDVEDVFAGTNANEISARVELFIENGNTSFNVALPIFNDTEFEPDETFTVTLSEQTPGTTISDATATTTIAANDPLSGMWAISTTTPTVNEAESASYTVLYTGNAANSGQSVSILVTVGFTGANQASADDIDGVTGTPELEALISAHLATIIGDGATADSSGISVRVERAIGLDGNIEFSFDLPIFDDPTAEAEETFMVTLSGQTPETTTIPGANASVTTTIAANDMTPGGMWDISQTSNATVNESETASYTVQYNGSSPEEQGATVSILVTVDLGTTGDLTTAEPEDFTPTLNSDALVSAINSEVFIMQGGTVTAGPTARSAMVDLVIGADGNKSFSFALPILDDDIQEGDETFMVTLSGEMQGTTNPNPTVTTTIAASDISGTWTISQTPTEPVNEGETVNYAVQYTIGDGTTADAAQGAIVSILITVGFTGVNPAEAEDFDGGLTSDILRDAIRTGTPTAGDPISAMVELTTDANGNASASFALPILDDAIQEGNETFTITLSGEMSGTTNPNPTVTTTIAASDISGTWTISQTPTEPVNERGTASYNVQYTTNAASAEQGATVAILVTVGFTTGQAMAEDFETTLTSDELAAAISGGTPTVGDPISAMVELTTAVDGNASFSFDLSILDDTDFEPDETFTVTLSQPSAGTMIDENADTVTTTIAADVVASGMWAIRTTNPTVNEGESASYTVQYTGTPAEQESTVSILVTVGFTPGQADENDFNPALTSADLASAITGDDVEVVTVGTTEISAMVELIIGTNGIARASIALPIFDDETQEGEETFTVMLSIPSGETTTLNLNSTTVTTTIADAGWGILGSRLTRVEGTTITTAIRYQGTQSSPSILVRLGGTVDGNDFDANPSTPEPDILTSAEFARIIREANTGGIVTGAVAGPPGELSARVTINPTPDAQGDTFFPLSLQIAINDDNPDSDDPEEDELLTITLIDPIPGATIFTGPIFVGGQAITITNAIRRIWAISPTGQTVTETQNPSYTVQYRGVGADTPSILVTVGFTTGQAAANDFDVDPSTFGIQPLSSTALAEAINRGTETGGGNRTAVPITTGTEIRARVDITAGPAGNQNFSFELPIFDDPTQEGNETFTVTLSGQTTGTTIDTNTATTTIADSDLGGHWVFTQTPTEPVNEGDDAIYTVQYTTNNSANSGQSVSILVTVGLTDGQAQAHDFTPTLTSATLRDAISPEIATPSTEISAMVPLTLSATGNASASIVLPILDDPIREGAETFTVTLSEQSTGRVIAPTATTTIAASDVTPGGTWAISQADLNEQGNTVFVTDPVTVNEGDDASYNVLYTGTPEEQNLTVSILVMIDLNTAEAEDFFTSPNVLNSTALASAISGGTPTAGDSGISAMVELTIDASGNASTSIALPIADDETQEGKETFTVTLAIPVGEITTLVPNSTTATTTIAASDIEGTWDISQASTAPVNEGETASYTVQYNSSVAAEQGATVSILVTVGFTTDQAMAEDFQPTLTSADLASAISGGIATAGDDISAVVELNIGTSGNASFSVALPILDDPTPEEEETFTVTFSEPTTGTTIPTDTVTTTIAANDMRPGGMWAILPENQTVNEGDDASYTVQYTGSAGEQGSTVSILVTVGFTTDQAEAIDFNPTLTSADLASAISGGTVTAGDAISARVVLAIDANGNAPFIFDLTIVDDAIREGAETFMVTLSQQTQGTTIDTPTATTTIAASDVIPEGMWAITPQNQTVNEGDDASYTVQYTGTPEEQDFTVSILVTVGFTTGQAEAEDFNPTLTSADLASAINVETATSRTEISAMVALTIDDTGNASTSIALPILDDTDFEPDETFTVTLSEQSDRTILGSTSSATTTIAANDMTPGGTWDISQADLNVQGETVFVTDPVTVNEGDNAIYTVRYVGTPEEQGSTVSILVTVGFTTDQAVAIDFNPTLTSADLASAISPGTPTAGAAISAMVELAIDDTGNATFIFDLTIVDDAIREGAETFMVTLSEQTEGTTIATNTVTTAIAASDVIPEGMWTIIPANQTVNEDESASYTVQYTGTPEEHDFTVSILVTVDLMAAETDDFTSPLDSAALVDAISTGTPTAGDSGISAMVELTIDDTGNASASIALPILNDAIQEGDETFTVTLSEQSDRTILGSTSSATTTIAASDIEGTWAITPDNQTVHELATASYAVQYTIGNGTTADAEQRAIISILVAIEFTDRQAVAEDFAPTLTSAELVSAIMASGETATAGDDISAMVELTTDANGNASFNFELLIADDEMEEDDETFTVTLSDPSDDSSVPSASASASTTIVADNVEGWGVAVVNLNTNEGSSIDAIIRYQGAQASPSILVRLDGTADGNDFDTNPDMEEIQPLTSESFATIIREADTGGIVTGAGAVAGPPGELSARVTIAPVSFVNDFNLFLDIVDDMVVEGDETLTITVTDPQPDVPIFTESRFEGSQTINIIDVVRTWTINPETQTVNEGETASYTVEYTSNAAERRVIDILVTVEFTGENPAASNDFDLDIPGIQHLTSATLAFGISGGTATARTEISTMVAITTDANGIASFNIALPILDDTEFEPDETFTVTLSDQTPGTTITTPTATTTIAASDMAPSGAWAISSTTPTVNEGEEASYTVEYDGTTAEQGSTVSIRVTVGFIGENQAAANDFSPTLTSNTLRDAISGGTPTAGNDISAMVALTIAADGNVSASVVLPILDDETEEGTETFIVTLSERTEGTMIEENADTATTTIAASDVILDGMWAITPENQTVNEDEDESARYTVQYTGSTAEQGETVSILVTVGFTNGQAQANDFTPTLTSSSFATFIGDGATAGDSGISARVARNIGVDGTVNISFDLPIANDTTTEGEETFTVTLSDPSDNSSVPENSASAATAIAASDQGWGVAVLNLNLNEGRSIDVFIRYQGIQSSPSILVRIDGTADGNDFDIDSLTTGIQPLTSAGLAAILESINGVTAEAVDSPGAISAARVTIDPAPESFIFNFNFFLNIAEDIVVNEGDETLTITVTEPEPDVPILNDAPFIGSQTINIINVVRTWTFTSTDQTVNEVEDETADYTVQYTTSNLDEEGDIVEILVTVEFPAQNPAEAEDFTSTLTSAALMSAISGLNVEEVFAGTNANEISAMVELLIEEIDENGNPSASFNVALPILDDTEFEPDETFTVTLTLPEGTTGTTISDATATTTIAANDPLSGMWAISTTNPTVNEAESASYTVRYTGITANSGQSVSILVTVGFTGANQASADDIDGVTGTPELEALISAHLATIIGNWGNG